MIDKQAFSNYVEKVIHEDYKARHEFKLVGILPDFVMADSAVRALQPFSEEIHVSDYQIRHALREFKSSKGANIPIEAAKKLPEKLESARWFYDSSHNNLLAVFDVVIADSIGKSVITINIKQKKKRDLMNVIVTSGKIKNEDLETAINRFIYREIKTP